MPQGCLRMGCGGRASTAKAARPWGAGGERLGVKSPTRFHCRAGLAPWPRGRLLFCRGAQPLLLGELLEQTWAPPQTNEVIFEGGAQELNV